MKVTTKDEQTEGPSLLNSMPVGTISLTFLCPSILRTNGKSRNSTLAENRACRQALRLLRKCRAPFLYGSMVPSLLTAQMQRGRLPCNSLPLNSVPTCNIQDHKSLEITAVKLSFVSYLYRGIHPRNPFNESIRIKEVSFQGGLSLTPSGHHIWEEVCTQLPPFLTD